MDAEKMIEFRAPNTKETSNPKQQRPGVRGLRVCSFRFGTWNFFGVWSLEFGILCAVALFLTGCLTKNDGLQNQHVLYPLAALDGGPALLLDPNKLSADGTVALKSYDITEDGNLMAYALSAAGSDWEEIHVRDVRTAKDSPDLVRWVKFSGASWTKDGKGFFYSRYDEPTEETRLTKANFFHKLYYHRLGTLQSEDKLIYHRPDHKDWNFNGR